MNGKKLVAVVMGLKTMQNDVKLSKSTQNQRKIRLISKENSMVAVVFEFFSRYDIYDIFIYIYIHVCIPFTNSQQAKIHMRINNRHILAVS